MSYRLFNWPDRCFWTPMARILVIDESQQRAVEICSGLIKAGHQVAAVLPSALDLISRIEEIKPDIILIETDSPSRDTLEQLAMLHRHAPRPVVMFSADGDDALIRDAVGAGVAAYVVDGLSPARLAPVLSVALARFEQQAHVRQRLDALERTLEDRKDIDRAKALLMERRGMGEAEAYAALRQQAMNQGLKLADVARRIVAMADLL